MTDTNQSPSAPDGMRDKFIALLDKALDTYTEDGSARAAVLATYDAACEAQRSAPEAVDPDEIRLDELLAIDYHTQAREIPADIAKRVRARISELRAAIAARSTGGGNG